MVASIIVPRVGLVESSTALKSLTREAGIYAIFLQLVGDGSLYLMRKAVAAAWAGIIGAIVATGAHFGLSLPSPESIAIGFFGGCGAAIFVRYFA